MRKDKLATSDSSLVVQGGTVAQILVVPTGRVI